MPEYESVLILLHPGQNGRQHPTGRYWEKNKAARVWARGMLAMWHGAPWYYGRGEQ